jgi:hypothetical protein
MHLTTMHYLLLIPLAAGDRIHALGLWNVTWQLAGTKAQAEKQPIIVVRAGDRYTLRSPTLRISEPRVASQAVGEHNRESVAGHGIRQASSSADPRWRR